jgi:hypothetical protein
MTTCACGDYDYGDVRAGGSGCPPQLIGASAAVKSLREPAWTVVATTVRVLSVPLLFFPDVVLSFLRAGCDVAAMPATELAQLVTTADHWHANRSRLQPMLAAVPVVGPGLVQAMDWLYQNRALLGGSPVPAPIIPPIPGPSSAPSTSALPLVAGGVGLLFLLRSLTR